MDTGIQTENRDLLHSGITVDPQSEYGVAPIDLGAPIRYFHASPPWLAEGGVTLPGLLLSEIGIAWPPLQAQQSLVLRAIRV